MLVPIDNATAVTDSAGIADDGSAISMDSLYPALIQCFAIIICGYFAGLLKIISTSETKGLNTFVGNFALPSLIFLSLVELDWKTVNWNFLLSILISKSIVFVIVLIISLLVSRQNYGRSGLFAIFCTQSNDFAIGYPIVMALYEKIHPEYASYIYLMAPISLAVLNPIGYILLEVSKVKERQKEIERSRAIMPCSQGELNTNKVCKGKILIVLKTIKSIFLNPNMFMTILGVIGGVAFPNAIPSIISNVLKVLGNSFAAPALFLLGLRMVGQGHKLQGHGVLVPGILIIVKLLVLPLVTRQTVNIINAGANVSETTDLSTFGYLYGTLPAAPGVFVIASQYNSDVDLIATSMVACTFISAPLIFISAKVISSTSLNPNDFLNELERFAFDISIIAIIACFWLLALFGLTKKFKRVPHRITCCLVISQLISSAGILLWATFGNKVKWVMYLQFCLFSIGNYSSRLWSAILAITLLFLECRSLCFVLKIWPLLVLTAWGVPSLFTSLLLLFDLGHITPTDRKNPNFQYGNAQAAVSIFLLVMCFIVIIGCLVLHQRYKKRYEKYLTLSKEVSTSETDIESINSTPTHSNRPNGVIVPANNRNVNFTINTTRIRRFSGPDNEENETDTSTAQNIVVGCGEGEGGCCSSKPSPSHTGIVVDIEDLLAKNQNTVRTESGPHGSGLCSSQFNCGGASRDNCQTLIHKYQENGRDGLEPIEYDATVDEHQILRHTILLILLLCSMFVNFALSVWTLVMEGMSGIYVELSFIDGFLNFGQSIMVLAVFITNTGELLNPFVKYWRKIWYGANILNLPPWDELSLETKHVCEQFVTHHLDSCRKSIAKDRRWRIKIYKKVFYGNEFVDWIVEVGLAHDRIDATHYAKRLVDGRALRHINNVYHFHDKNLLYTFCNRL